MIYKNNFGFTIVELMVAIIIFTIWWLSAYLLIYASITSSIKSKNEIVAANLCREQIELIKNLRDTNWLQIKTWDKLDSNIIKISPTTPSISKLDEWFYTIENNFAEPDISNNIFLKINKLDWSFDGTKNTIINNPAVKLCLDSKNRYTHDCTPSVNKNTSFYSFIKIEKLKTKNTIIPSDLDVNNAYKIISTVANTDKWYTEYNINTIITDWKKN